MAEETLTASLSSTSRLGRASYIVYVGLSLAGLLAGISAAVSGQYDRIILAAVLIVMSLLIWGTRVRTVADSDEVKFTQLGKTLVVPLAEVESCLSHQDALGLGAGLRWLGKGQWVMLSGDSYCEIRYSRGRNLIVSHRDAPELARVLNGGDK